MDKLQIPHPCTNVVLQMIAFNYPCMLVDNSKQLREIFVLRAQYSSLRAGS